MNKFIIFDLDNTFYNYKHSHLTALKSVYTFQDYYDSYDKFLSDYEEAKKVVQKNLKNNPSRHSKLIYFKQLFDKKISIAEIIKFEEIYWNEFINASYISEKAIKILKERKLPEDLYFLFTNQNTNIQLNKIDQWGLNIFDAIITSEEVGYEKPHKNFYKLAESLILDTIKNREYNFYSLGDDFENDIKYWQEKFNANAYFIDNNKTEITVLDSELTNVDGKVFKIQKEVLNTSFELAIYDIFN